jgi:hypothetical protein
MKFSKMAHTISAERSKGALHGMRALEQSVELATSKPGRVDQQPASVDDCKDMASQILILPSSDACFDSISDCHHS